ncbi:uncharacterized protein LOC142608901 [Castanea sativa]|uniref:uncharacterized protein LOC142608901 n=1 Tax=Castanea sativa TaxID=21020 RepID=UPI003F652C95
MHQPSCSPHLLATSAKERLAEFISAQLAHNPSPPWRIVRWQPPPQGMIKINFDGSTSAKDQASSIGVVLRDENGSVLASLAQQLPQLYTPLIIEAKAALRALQFAAELGFNQVILEGDCQVLIKALKEDSMFLCIDGLFIEDVLLDAIFFNELHYSHVKRGDNKVAHSLARYALGVLNFVVWMEDVPPSLFFVVQGRDETRI